MPRASGASSQHAGPWFGQGASTAHLRNTGLPACAGNDGARVVEEGMNDQPSRPTGARARSLDEVKAEVLRRAGRFSPFESIRPQDAATVMTALTSLDRDHWAEQWCRIGLGYEAEGDARTKAGAGGEELAEL